ncbi:MAG: nitroreductase family protein [Bacillota bacterium]
MSKKKLNFKELAQKRRSVNFFDENKQLDDKTLKNIINLAVLAPSSMNSQPWKVIAVKSKEKRKELYEKACEQKKVLKAPVTLIILGDKEGYKRDNDIWDEKIKLGRLDEEKIKKIISSSDKNLYNTNEKKVAYAVRNSSLLAMSIMYSAKYYGVESHPMIGFDAQKTRELYNIDSRYEITMMISLGYFNNDHELYPRETRFKYDKIVEEY